MKKITVFLGTFLLLFTLAGCSRETVLVDLDREILYQDNKEVDGETVIQNTISNFYVSLEDITGFSNEENINEEECRDHNNDLLDQVTMDPTLIKQSDIFIDNQQSVANRIHYGIYQIENTYKNYNSEEGTLWENVEGNNELFYVNDNYAFVSIEGEGYTEYHKLVIEDDRLVYEHFRVHYISEEEYQINYSLNDSKLGQSVISLFVADYRTSFQYRRFDVDNKKLTSVQSVIEDNAYEQFYYMEQNFKEDKVYMFQTMNNLPVRALHILEDHERVLHISEYYGGDGYTVDYSLKYVEGWNNIQQTGLYLDDTNVYDETFISIEGILLTGTGISVNLESTMTEEDIKNINEHLTFSGDVTMKQITNGFEDAEEKATSYYSEDNLMFNNEEFITTKEFVNYIISLLPESYQENINN